MLVDIPSSAVTPTKKNDETVSHGHTKGDVGVQASGAQDNDQYKAYKTISRSYLNKHFLACRFELFVETIDFDQ